MSFFTLFDMEVLKSIIDKYQEDLEAEGESILLDFKLHTFGDTYPFPTANSWDSIKTNQELQPFIFSEILQLSQIPDFSDLIKEIGELEYGFIETAFVRIKFINGERDLLTYPECGILLKEKGYQHFNRLFTNAEKFWSTPQYPEFYKNGDISMNSFKNLDTLAYPPKVDTSMNSFKNLDKLACPPKVDTSVNLFKNLDKLAHPLKPHNIQRPPSLKPKASLQLSSSYGQGQRLQLPLPLEYPLFCSRSKSHYKFIKNHHEEKENGFSNEDDEDVIEEEEERRSW